MKKSQTRNATADEKFYEYEAKTDVLLGDGACIEISVGGRFAKEVPDSPFLLKIAITNFLSGVNGIRSDYGTLAYLAGNLYNLQSPFSDNCKTMMSIRKCIGAWIIGISVKSPPIPMEDLSQREIHVVLRNGKSYAITVGSATRPPNLAEVNLIVNGAMRLESMDFSDIDKVLSDTNAVFKTIGVRELNCCCTRSAS